MADQQELKALVDGARRSDPDAWDTLYQRSYARLFDYARRRLIGPEEADDAVSEAFVRAYEAIGRFRWRGAGFDAWMYGILRNVILEAYRRGGRYAPLDTDHRDDAPEPLDRVLANEEHALLRAAFERLTADDREVLELRVVGGLTSKEVAAVLGKRAGAVRMAQARALERLRGLLSEGDAG